MTPRDTGAQSTWLAPFAAALLLLFTVGVALPTNIYAANVGDFSITVRDLLMVALPIFTAAALFCGLLFKSFRSFSHPRFVALLLALALLAWLQGNILVWQYGPLDGRTIDWDGFRLHGMLDGAIWLVVLAFAAWKPAIFGRAAVVLSPTLILLQLLFLAVVSFEAASMQTDGTVRAFKVDESGKFEFSATRNAFLIVVDEAQTDVFSEIVESDPAYEAIFDGFTYFPDAVAASNFTEVAIPALLTGRLYDNSVPKAHFMEEAYLGTSIFATLMRHGYRVEIYPWGGWANESLYFSPQLAHNLVPASAGARGADTLFSEKKAKEIIHLLDLSLFRSVPHVFKPRIYNDQRWFVMRLVGSLAPADLKQLVSTDDRFETSVFGDLAASEMRVSRSDAAFKYYHLKGAHSPLMVNSDLELVRRPIEFTREAYIHQFKASLLGLEIFFDQLRQHGLYDGALIAVVGDHGSGFTEEMYVNSVAGTRAQDTVDPKRNRRNFPKDKARALALVLIKPPDASGTMTRSATPVSLLDLPSTIISALGLDAPMEGISMFDPVDRAGRLRRYAAFDYSENKRSYVGPMTLYGIDGHSHRDESWIVLDVVSPP